MTGGIDPRNGIVTKGYEEVSAAYWNLIYKDAAQPGKVPNISGSSQVAEDLNIATFDNELMGYLANSKGSQGSKNYI